jgi:hypothetical protein
MAKPTSHLNWTDGDASKITEPVSGKKLLGWTADERPPFQYFNWLFWDLDQWNKYFEGLTDAMQAQVNTLVAAGKQYAAIVGSTADCTHANLAAALADSAVPAGSKILQKVSETAATRYSVSKSDIRIECMPGVSFSKNGDTVCFEVSGARFKLTDGRILGFTASGDNASILSTSFGVGTDTEVDDTAVTVGRKPILGFTRTEV